MGVISKKIQLDLDYTVGRDRQ